MKRTLCGFYQSFNKFILVPNLASTSGAGKLGVSSCYPHVFMICFRYFIDRNMPKGLDSKLIRAYTGSPDHSTILIQSLKVIRENTVNTINTIYHYSTVVFRAEIKACFSLGVGDGRGRKGERRVEREGRMKMRRRMRLMC